MLQFECHYPAQVPTRDGGKVDFHPESDGSHRELLDRQIAKFKARNPDAKNAQLESIDKDRRVAILVDRSVAVIEQESPDRKLVQLEASQQKPSMGDKVATQYERRLAGFKMTEFRPYEGIAVFERLTPEQATARGLLTAALGLKPWDAKLEPTSETDKQGRHGWRVTLGQGVVYQPSKHDGKTQEACEQIGAYGWWFEADARAGIIVIHPGEPANFEKAHPLPADTLGDAKWRDKTPFGVLLPKAGSLPYDTACVDWREGAFLLAGGSGGSGKTVFANALLAEQIAQGVDLTIIDTKSKSTDYFWARPFVKPGHWGCESVFQAAGVLNNLVAEMDHGERAKAWAENAWQSWYDIPDWAKEKFPIHVIVVDEYSSLVDEQAAVKSIPNPDKILPPIIRQQYKGYAEYLIRYNVTRILRLARFMGYRLMLFSQTINDKSGLGPTIRDLFQQRVAMGPNPSESLEKGVFHDLPGMPSVPAHIVESGRGKGVGRGEFEGLGSRIFKTWWAGRDGMVDTEWYGRTLAGMGFLPDWVDRDRYFNTIGKHGPDDPIDAQYMHELTDRISLPLDKAIATDQILSELRNALADAEANFGGGGDDEGEPASSSESSPSGGNDDPAPIPGAPPAPVPSASGEGTQVMDVENLARFMRGRG